MAVNADRITAFHALRMCSFQRDSTMMAVVKLPAAPNVEMPWDLCPEQDIYMEVPERALRNLVTARSLPATSVGPSWAHCAKVRIEHPERVYAAYDIASDSAAVEAMLRAGMSRPEIDAVAFRSIERNWPEGIDSFEKRWPALEVFKKYRAYLGARWGNKALLIVPVEENLRMPLMLRPYMDMYFVYDAEAVARKGRVSPGKRRQTPVRTALQGLICQVMRPVARCRPWVSCTANLRHVQRGFFAGQGLFHMALQGLGIHTEHRPCSALGLPVVIHGDALHDEPVPLGVQLLHQGPVRCTTRPPWPSNRHECRGCGCGWPCGTGCPRACRLRAAAPPGADGAN
jgi:hypothetical protein